MTICKIRSALIATAALGLAACSQQPAPSAAAEPQMPYRPDASIQDLMVNVVDHNADTLWESVAVISSEKGIEERQPRTNEDWAAVRVAAIALSEAT
ncbi:MAG TPA: hypothetical protein VGO53_13105, partial [Steroidobacteraceae bacterium]|nr:hypothetical protein [Steroidobacteraceae bacterium]